MREETEFLVTFTLFMILSEIGKITFILGAIAYVGVFTFNLLMHKILMRETRRELKRLKKEVERKFGKEENEEDYYETD